MCTVTLFPLRSGVIRLACNRDEQHARTAALPPRIVTVGGGRAIMPIDPAGGGTWIAANDGGLIMTLLNLNLSRAQGGSWSMSRGKIIQRLIGCSNVEQALHAAAELDSREYGPFRLVMVERKRAAQVLSDSGGLRAAQLVVGSPLLFTSSGLGDQMVERPRRRLFEEMVARDGVNEDVQDAFHRHSWPARGDLSVCMRRRDARTVSHTVIELESDMVSLSYHAGAPDEPATDYCASFPLLEGVVV